MEEYIGLDISLKNIAISVRTKWQAGMTWEARIRSASAGSCHPDAAGQTCVFRDWSLFCVVLPRPVRGSGFPRSASTPATPRRRWTWCRTIPTPTMRMAWHIWLRVGNREVRVKRYHSMLIGTLVTARPRLIRITTELSNQIHGTHGDIWTCGAQRRGLVFEMNVRNLSGSNAGLERIILPLLEPWRSIRSRAAQLGGQLVAATRQSDACHGA
jgi:transposase